ncbi:hypothetical protein [uncultured Allomuricauda sp.]|uniref:hypothetical protein n=1 Tax=Flagellimonas sp. W118 TaxID=3410791 RepID=UPI0026362FA5|nr:hypothetical protein [uncultured Allomuricauda sp.]
MNNIKNFLVLALAILVGSCSEDDKLTLEVQDIVTRGAIIRTLNTESGIFQANDLNSAFSITIEEQDDENGGLMQSLEVFLTFVDNTDDGIDNNVSETLYQSIPSSAFTSGSNGLPVIDLQITLQEALTALGIPSDGFTGGDSFTIRLELVLTDGRSFTNIDATGNVSGGSFFSSPYSYSALLVCPFDQSIFDGNYTVIDDVWADYTPGQSVPVVPGDEPNQVFILSTNNPFITNPSTSYMILEVDPENGNVTISSNEPFDYGTPGAPFPIAVGGTGTVNTCNGAIDLNVDFVGQGIFHFELEKQ